MLKLRSLIFFLCNFLVISSNGSPEIGFSATIDDKFAVEKNNWTTVRGWKSTASLLIFEYGIKLDESKSSATVPIDGLYFTSLNLIINKASKNMLIKACVSSHHCQSSNQNEKTVTIAFISFFAKNQNISVKLHGNASFFMMEKSSFAMQYLGSMATNHAFLAVLKKDVMLHTKYEVIKGWEKQKNKYLMNTHKTDWFSNDGSFSVHCSGIYLISAVIKLSAGKGKYEVKLTAGSHRILSKHYTIFKHSGITSITEFEKVELRAKDKISISINGQKSQVQVLEGSTFSAVYIGKNSRNISEFSVLFDKKMSFEKGKQSHTLKDYIPDTVLKEKLIKLSTTEDYQIAMPRHGIYILSLHLHLNITINDQITIKVSVWTEGIQTVKNEENGWILNENSKNMVITSVLLTGLLSLGNTDFVVITLESKNRAFFQIIENSRISFTAVRAQSIAAGFVVEEKSVATIGWTELTLIALPHQTFQLNPFLVGEGKRFKIPLRGHYLITINLILFSHTARFTNFSVEISRKNFEIGRSSANGSNLFAGTFSASKDKFSFNPTGVYSLNENDILTFRLGASIPFSVTRRSSIFVCLVDYPESGRTFISKISNTLKHIPLDVNGFHAVKTLMPETVGSVFFDSFQHEISFDAGFYLITCYVQLKLDFIADVSSVEAILFVHFDDKDMNFGLKDMLQIRGSKNESKIILLNVNEVVKAKASSKLKVVLKLNIINIYTTILSGRLSVTLSNSDKENAPEIFRHVQASTKLLTINRNGWKYIGENIQNEKDGEFKTRNVEFVGPHFLAKGPIVGYVSATTMINGIEGILDYGMVVLPASESSLSSGLTVETYSHSKTSTTLKWSGLVYLEPWQQLSLAIKRRKDSISKTEAGRSSWSSLSFMALLIPESTFQTWPSLSQRTKLNTTIKNEGLYLLHENGGTDVFERSPSKSIDWLRKGDAIEFPSEYAKLFSVPFSKFKNIWTQKKDFKTLLQGKALYNLSEIFDKISSERGSSPLPNQKNKNCLAGILSIKLIFSSDSNVTDINLVYFAKGEQLILSSVSSRASKRSRVLQLNGVFCFHDPLGIGIANGKKEMFNLTIASSSSFLFGVINSARHMEGFSALQLNSQTFQFHVERLPRLDGWNVKSKLSFDATVGFRSPFGSYLVVSPGIYLVTSTIVLQTNFSSIFKLSLFLDGSSISQDAYSQQLNLIKTSALSISMIVNIEKAQQLELKLSSSNAVSATVKSGSSFSVVLLDPDISIGFCSSHILKVKTVSYNNKAFRIGQDVIIPCDTEDSRVVDFYWLQNKKIVRFIPSSLHGALVLKKATARHSGVYHCSAQIGDYTAISHAINILVYDPTPNVTTDTLNVFLPENALPNLSILNINVQAATSLGKNDAPVQLSISPDFLKNLFHIEPHETTTSAVLKTSSTFDHEARNRYNLTLIAKNQNFSGDAHSFTHIVVYVTDENDNPPILKRQSHVIEIYRSISVGKEIYKVFATDKDSGKNAIILYSLHNNSDSEFFSINGRTGSIQLKKQLMEEIKTSYVLFVIAENQQFRVFTQITVNVLEVNRNRPYFNPEVYQINVTEDIPVGSVISRVHSHDLDERLSNANIFYKVLNSSEKAAISIDKLGIVQTADILGKYAGTSIVFKILAFDSGGLSSSNMAVINLHVAKSKMELFSSRLRFEKDVYNVRIKENVPIGSFVLAVKALFPISSNYILKYVCLKSKDSDSFTISETTGKLYTRSLFDFEAVGAYSLTIFACDINENAKCVAAKVSIKIEDVNDNVPSFANLFYNLTIAVNASVGTTLVRLVAKDEDSGTFGLVNYEIENTSEMLPFSIGKSNGDIKLSKPFSVNSPRKFIFGVSASNNEKNSQKGQCLIQVNIIGNGSDSYNLLAFAKDFYEFSIPEDQDVKQYIQNITVSSPANMAIKYSLFGNNDLTFGVEENSGRIVLLKKTDFERKKRYDMFLIAELKTEIMVRGFTRVVIAVTDVNDNSPVFVNKNNHTILHKGNSRGAVVAIVKAYDSDSGTNSKIYYKLKTFNDAFVLDANSGRLAVQNISQGRSYDVVIEACDNGIPSLCSQTMVIVRFYGRNAEGKLGSDFLSSNTTSIQLQFGIEEYVPDLYEKIGIRFIAQEKHDDYPEYQSYTQLPALTWYDVNHRRNKDNNFLRRFVAAENSEIIFSNKRAKRSLGEVKSKKISFIFGDGEDCNEIWRHETICNGPLRPATEYRFQLEIKYQGSDNFITTGFTKSYQIDSGVVGKVASSDFNTVPFWIALAVISGLLFLLLFNLLVCFCARRFLKKIRKKERYEVGIQKNNSPEEYFLPGTTETESQELTVWFSEESVCNGTRSLPNTAKKSSNV